MQKAKTAPLIGRVLPWLYGSCLAICICTAAYLAVRGSWQAWPFLCLGILLIDALQGADGKYVQRFKRLFDRKKK